MRITRIELQNIKSYSDNVVTFTAGTNAICGENGAGKSTLLEAIGFTLFNQSFYRIGYMKAFKVTVEVCSLVGIFRAYWLDRFPGKRYR